MKIKKNDNWQKLVGQRLETAAKVLDKKQVDMGTVAGASPQAWNNYVHGARPLPIDAAISLCNRFGLTLDWIYRGDPSGLPRALADKLAPMPDSSIIAIKRR